jgi:SNF2 family DNA or RNA helicase
MDTGKFRKVERAIQNFQNNDECRVFLISLKADGVWLNLTTGDYV